MNSHVSKEMGITMARWILTMIGQQGGIKINTGIYDRYDLGDDKILKQKQIITLGTKGELITVEDCLSFLKKLEKYGDNKVFIDRSYYFYGIYKREKGYEFAW
jgi:hypothetical protein